MIILGDSIELFTMIGTSPWSINYTLNSENQNLFTNNNSYFFTPPSSGIFDYNVNSISDNFCSQNLDLSTMITVKDTSLLTFDKYVVTKWDNIFILNLRKLENENLLPNNCLWYENDILLGEGMSYSKGNNISDKFIGGAIYRFEIETASGQKVSTNKIYVLEKAKSIKIYPNPISVNQTLTIEYLGEIMEDGIIEIYDELGKKIILQMEGNKTTIPNIFISGTYVVKINNNTTKLIVR
ncbi:hypothetical protein AGMMS49959_16950 [Planctomycetales bacterium]|nr:hypothetical protein AGMMS49959_16950 [Planctomycetales bacterium]